MKMSEQKTGNPVPGKSLHTEPEKRPPLEPAEKRVSLLVAKKRHMSGMMCPPSGLVSTIENNPANERLN